MKVNNKLNSPTNVDAARITRSEVNKTADNNAAAIDAKNKAVKSSVNVNVSDRAQFMNQIKEAAGRTTVDEAKVARLQKLIDEGKYKVDADKIADRLVDEHLNTPD